MSEQTQINPVANLDLAWDMAQKEASFRDVAMRMREIGQPAVADIVVQQGINDAEVLQQGPTLDENVGNIDATEETEKNHELVIQTVTKETVAVFDMWFTGREQSGEDHFTGRDILQQVYTNKHQRDISYELHGVALGFIGQWEKGVKHNENALKGYIQEGINEAVLVSSAIPNSKFGQGNPDSNYQDDPLVVVGYQTLPDYLDAYGRPGAYLRSQLYLPETVANMLIQEVSRDPRTMRELMRSIMDTRIHAAKDWERSRPPYEKWKEDNNGIEKMAVFVPDATGRAYNQTILEAKAA